MTLPLKGRTLKASVLSLAVGLGLSACSSDYTAAYVYMVTQGTQTQSNHSLLNSYQVDYQSGYLYTMPDSPNDAGGRNGVAIVAAPNSKYLYVINNFDSAVVEFAIGTDGKLYPQNTYNISGSLPVAAAIDPAGKYLYVAFTYQNNPDGTQFYTPANPGPGGISVFPINADNTLGKPATVNVGRNPAAITTSPGGFVYLAEQDSASSANILGFNPAITDPKTLVTTMSPLPGVTINAGNVPSNGFASDQTPAGLIVDSTGTHLYVTDKTANNLAYYTIGANGVPTLIAKTPTDGGPMGMSFDLQGKYLYVAANVANAIDGFNLGANGIPTRSSVAASVQSGNGPTCVTVIGSPSSAHPTHAVYLYTSNSLSNSVTAEQLDESTGALDKILGTPFGGSTLPSCIISVPALPR